MLVEKTKNRAKTTIVYDAMDPQRFTTPLTYKESFRQRYSLPESEYIIANTAALSEEKDYFTFIDTAKKSIENGLDALFLIVGKGNLELEIKSYIESQQMNKHIHMLGFIHDMNDILSHIDLLLVTSKQEGLGSSILDAFSKKIPVVATKVGGIPELVLHEETGMLADIGDAETLAEHVENLLTNPTLTTSIKATALKFLEEHFLIEKMQSETLKVYKEALEG